jgi:hypothetical protein
MGTAFRGRPVSVEIITRLDWADQDPPLQTPYQVRRDFCKMDRKSRQALNVQRSNCTRITERLACRVKGLTAVFCILLLTIRFL